MSQREALGIPSMLQMQLKANLSSKGLPKTQNELNVRTDLLEEMTKILRRELEEYGALLDLLVKNRIVL